MPSEHARKCKTVYSEKRCMHLLRVMCTRDQFNETVGKFAKNVNICAMRPFSGLTHRIACEDLLGLNSPEFR